MGATGECLGVFARSEGGVARGAEVGEGRCGWAAAGEVGVVWELGVVGDGGAAFEVEVGVHVEVFKIGAGNALVVRSVKRTTEVVEYAERCFEE